VLTESKQRHDREPISHDDASLALLASSVIATLCVSTEGKLLSANTTVLRLLSIDPATLLERDFKTEILADATDWHHWERAKLCRRVTIEELELCGSRGREIYVKGDIWAMQGRDGEVDHLFGVFTDITQSRRIETALAHTARMKIPLETLPTGNERILLLTDDPECSATIKESLEMLGYTVLLSRRLEERFDIPTATAFNLLLVDTSVSNDIGAIQLFDANHIDEPEYGVVLNKPFSLNELAATVRRVLDGEVDA
jgi:PAS domain S-box-containing protein